MIRTAFKLNSQQFFFTICKTFISFVNRQLILIHQQFPKFHKRELMENKILRPPRNRQKNNLNTTYCSNLHVRTYLNLFGNS